MLVLLVDFVHIRDFREGFTAVSSLIHSRSFYFPHRILMVDMVVGLARQEYIIQFRYFIICVFQCCNEVVSCEKG